MEEDLERIERSTRALVLAEGVHALDMTLDTLTQHLAAVIEDGADEVDSEFFRRGLLAAMTIASAQRLSVHAQRIFEDEWPAELVAEVFAGLDPTAGVTAAEYLPLAMNALATFRDTYRALYERVAEGAGLPAFDANELRVDDEALKALLSDER